MGFAASEDRFHERAAKAAGTADFGDPSYLEGLRVLLAAYDEEAHFTETGRVVAEMQIVEILRRRLTSERAYRQLEGRPVAEVRRPIIILGLIRTGSTALQYLMGQDPDTQCLPYWLSCFPQPRPPVTEWPERKEYRTAQAEIDAMYAFDPSLKAIHFIRADLPEECRHLLAQNFTDDCFEVNAHTPAYSSWYETQSLTNTYERHRRLIGLIGTADPGRRWLLKYPVHARHLRSLLAVYPDACIVWTHRDPARVLTSYASLIAGFRAIYEDGIDRAAVAHRQADLWAAGMERAISVRSEFDSAQFYDLDFHDFVNDAVGSVRKIYDYFDQPLSPEGKAALEAWQAANPQHKHGKHAYDDSIGITREQIWDRFAGYMDHFGMPRE